MTRRPLGCLGIVLSLLLAFADQDARAASLASRAGHLPRWNPAAPTDAGSARLEPACTPDRPTVTATPGCGYIDIEGTLPHLPPSCIPTSAKIWRDDVLQVTLTSTTSWRDTAPSPGVAHTYKVILYNGTTPGPAGYATATSPGMPGQVSPAPTVVSLCGGIRISWTAPTGTFAGFHINRYRGTLLLTVATLGASARSYEDAVSPGNSYTYTVTAFNGPCKAGESPASVAVTSGTPATPATPGISQACGSITVTWAAPQATGITGYQVLRSGVNLASVGSGVRSYADYSAVPGVDYVYTVVAINGSCSSAASPASGTAHVLAPAAPAKPTVAAACGAVTVSWGQAAGPLGSYRIFRKGVQIAEVSSTAPRTYGDAGAVASSYYTVQAVNGSCLGAQSPVSDTISPIAILAVPNAPLAQGGCGKVTVTWEATSGATGYSVYRNGAYLRGVPAQPLQYDDLSVTSPSSYTISALNSACAGPQSPPSVAAAPTNPGQPGNVTATATCSAVTVRWTVASGSVTGYQIYRNGQPLASVASSPLVYQDAEATGTVAYTVAALNNTCEGPQSTASSSTTRPTTPGAPGVPAVTEGCGVITVRWTVASGDVTRYKVYRGDSFLGQVGSAVLSYEDRGAPPNSTYKVLAANGDCEGPFSSISSSATPGVTPATPGTPNLTLGCGFVEIRWTAPVPPFTGFRLYRNGALLDRTFGAVDLTYRDEDVSTSAYYSVSAVNGSCEGPLSTRSATVQIPTAPGVPGTPTATGGCGQVTVAWTAASGTVTGYRILRLGTFLEQVTGLSYQDRSAPPNSTYQVVAVNGECQGPASGTSGAASLTVAPPAPTGLAATSGCGRVSLAWTAPAPPFTAFKLYKNNVVLVASLPETTRHYEDNAATGNASYKVAALNGSCEGSASNLVSAAPATAPPAPSGKPTVTPGCGKLTVTWNASSGATGYRVYRGTDLLATAAASPRSYEDPEAPANSIYQVSAVTGTCEGGKSTASDPRSPLASPGTPGTPVATGICSGVRVAWGRIPAFAGQYVLYRNGSLLASVAAADSAYSDMAAPAGAVYRVSAKTTSCEGPLSAASAAASPANPGPVGSPQVTVDCNRLIVTWSAPTGTLTGYRVYRNNVLLTDPDLPAGVLRYEDIGAPPNSVYKIVAFNGTCEGLSSAPTSPQSPVVLPVIATAPEVTPDCGKVSVSWVAASGTVDVYRLFRGAEQIAELPGNTLGYDDASAAGESRYTVRAVRQSCEGPSSPASTSVLPIVVPGAAAAPVAMAGCGYINLSWQPPGGSVTAYRVMRNGAQLTEVPGTVLQYSDRAPLQNASYAIVALNGTCLGPASSASTEVSPTGSPDAPAAPTLEAACGQVTIRWQDVVGATSFVILRDGARLDSLPAAEPHQFVDTAPGLQERRYAVAAKNDCGEGVSPSAPATAPARPDPPANLQAQAACGNILLTWDAQAGTSKFMIYRDGALFDSVSTGASFDDTRPGTTAHRYEVSGFGACGESARSSPVTATAGLVPGAPGAPSLTTGCSSIQVRWTAVNGAQSYSVRRDGQLLATGVTGVSFTDPAPGAVRRCYTVQAAAGDCTGPESEDACATAAPCARQVTIETTGSESTSGYRMVAFPVQAGDATIEATLQDDLGPADPTKWRFGCWIPTQPAGTGTGGYVEPEHGLTSIQPGLGYWLLTRDAARIGVTGLPVSSDPFEIALAGPANSWHQIGNPFLARVPVQSIRVRVDGGESQPLLTQSGNLTEKSFQRWDQGQHVPETVVLDTLTGYWLRKIDARTVTLIIPSPVGAEATDEPEPAPSWPAEVDWAIAVEARQGDTAAGRILLGVADVPEDRWNPLSLAAPPAPLGGAATLAARATTWGLLNGDYQRLIQRDADRLTWTIQLSGLRPGQSLTLRLVGHDFPADRQVVRCDAAGNALGAWSLESSTTLVATGESMTLHFLVQYRGVSVTPPAVTLPVLLAAPNPFRRATEFTVRLDRTGPIHLEIFDARGRFVRRLEGEIGESRVETLWWDARDSNGRLVPSGIYFVRPEGDTAGQKPQARLVKLP